MLPSEVRFLFEYNAWANRKLLATAAGLSHEQYMAPRPHVGSVHELLTHVFMAQWVWRQRMETLISPVKMPEAVDFASLGELSAAWEVEEAEQFAFLDSLSEAQLAVTFDYRTLSGVKMRTAHWMALLHVVNHGTQHRAEAAAILTELGHSPGDMDLIVYVRATIPGAVSE